MQRKHFTFPILNPKGVCDNARHAAAVQYAHPSTGGVGLMLGGLATAPFSGGGSHGHSNTDALRVRYRSVRLTVAGRELGDDWRTLSDEGIHDGAQISCQIVGSVDTPELSIPAPTATAAPAPAATATAAPKGGAGSVVSSSE